MNKFIQFFIAIWVVLFLFLMTGGSLWSSYDSQDSIATLVITGLISLLLVGGFWIIRKIWEKVENIFLKLGLSFLVVVSLGFLIFFLVVVLVVVFYLTY